MTRPAPGRVAVGRRLVQGLRALRPVPAPDLDELPCGLLTPSQRGALAGMPPYDQAHLVRVYERLRARGVTDQEVLVAALLHDIGKVTASGRVRLIDRVLLVVLGQLAGRRARLPGGAGRGLAIARDHARLGAGRAAELGCSARTCWLIAHHHDKGHEDGDLALLQWADSVD